MEELAKGIKSLADDVTEEEFRVFVQQQNKTFANLFQKPDAIANELRLTVLEKERQPLYLKNRQLQTITFNDFQNFCRQFTKEMKIKAIMQGNLTQDRALPIIGNFLETLNCGKIENVIMNETNQLRVTDISLLPFKLCSVELHCMKVPRGASYLRVNTFNQNDVNSYTVNIYQIAPQTFRLKAQLDLLMLIAEDIVFDILRNKEQLGYSVGSSVIDNFGVLSYRLYVESQENKFTADHVDERIENLRRELLASLEKMNEHDFEQIKVSLSKLKLEEDNELVEETNRNWNEIASDDYVFDRRHKEVDEIKLVTKQEVIQLFRDNFGANERKLCTQLIGNPDAAMKSDDEKTNDVSERVPQTHYDNISFADFKKPNNGFLIKSIPEFKSTLEAYPVIRRQ